MAAGGRLMHDEFARLLAEAKTRMEAQLDEPGGPPADLIEAKRAVAYVPISDELAMDMGLIPDTRPPAPPPSWRTRLRWWSYGARERLAARLYRFVSGHEVPSDDDR